MPGGLRATFDLGRGHLGKAQDRCDDVVEIMRDAAGELPHHLHAKRALEPSSELGAVALEQLALDRVANGVAREPHHGQREENAPRGPNGIEAQDAPRAAGHQQRHASPALHAEVHERCPGGARGQQVDIPHGDDAQSDLLELLGQRQRRLRPS